MSHFSSEFRLFISSTFHDLHEERSYLAKYVFPKIRSLCRERGIEFTEIDLRWGLTEEEASLGRVIRTCLEEIDRCRPYFLGLLGDRIGWLPNAIEVQKDNQLLEQYPWVEEAVLDGASLVELEFREGILNKLGRSEGFFVYARSSESRVESERERLSVLKRRIEEAGLAIRKFDDLADLGKAVLTDLTAIIERDWPPTSALSQLDLERRYHDVFASTRRKAYIVNPHYQKSLADHVELGSKPLVVLGPSGAGKSALLAHFVAKYRTAHPEDFVVAHYVGATAAASDAQTVLYHLLSEIRERYAVAEDLPDTKEELEKLLPKHLGRIQDEKLLLIIDAINQLPSPDNQLGWLPDYLPPNVRLIVSTTPGESYDAIKAFGWDELVVKPLSVEEREAIVVRFLGEYHKGLSRAELTMIARDPKSASPLFLRTLLEELRLTGEFELLDATIGHYLRSRDLDDLFQHVLERMEHDYGHDLVASVMASIAQSRFGLSETELLGVTHADRRSLSTLLLALDFHLMKPNGYFSFFHDYLRNAVRKRYLANPSIARTRHKELARYFRGQEMSARRIDEEPWQWLEAGDKFELRSCLASLDFLDGCVTFGKTSAFLGYWARLEEDHGDLYLHEIERYATDHTALETARISVRVAAVLQKASYFRQSEVLYRKALGIFEENAEEQARVEALNGLGSVLQSQGRLGEAETALNNALAATQSAGDTLGEINVLRNLGSLLFQKDDLDAAESALRKVLESSEGAAGPFNAQAVNDLDSLAAVLFKRGLLDEAESLMRRSLSLIERHEGKTTDYARILNNIGAVLHWRGENTEAMACFREAAKTNRRLLGRRNEETLQNELNLALVLSYENIDEAEKLYREILPVMEVVFGMEHPQTLKAKGNYAGLRSRQGSYEEAESLLLEVISHYERIYGPDSLNVIQTNVTLGLHYCRAGKSDTGLSLLERSVTLKESLLGANHPSAKGSRQLLEEEMAKRTSSTC